MASKIDEKYADLKSKGFDLGAPTSAEQDAGYGGTFRTYQNGNIYWHPVMGASAHEVHGGILSIYTANGGPGVSPHTGIRDFGFPLTDESTTTLDRTPFSEFEWGAIYWTQGTGGVLMYTDVYLAYRANSAGLGLPISNLATIYTGSGIFCERGIIWTHPDLKGKCIVGSLTPPLMGQPMLLEAGATNLNLGNLIFFSTPGNDLTHALSLVPPEALSLIWQGHVVLSPVGGGADVPLSPGPVNTDSMTSLVNGISISLTAQGALADAQLYDISVVPPTGNRYVLSPHCVYAKKSWDNFGLLHATDIHLSLRNQNLRAALQKAGMTDAAQNYSNCQECFRDFIRYANHLHSLGLADAVFATGDLIDYAAEPDDNPYTGNFIRFRRMILGQPFDSGVPAYEELKIPVFATFGNHDYRINQFVLKFDINVDIPFFGKDVSMDEYSTFNLTPDEATLAQGGNVTYGLSDFDKGLAMLKYDATGGAYFAKHFSPTRTFVVALGPHRLVVLDNLYDAGVPSINGWEDLVKFLLDYETNSLSTAVDRALSGTIDAAGLTPEVLAQTAPALNAAGSAGVVIVGMHVPPFSPVSSEYPYYLRESMHPSVDSKLTKAYLDRNQFKTDGWSLTGTPYFKTGEIGNGHGLDNGVISEYGMDFIRLLAGVGATRPVDLFLCGHHHDRTEYRVHWDGSDVQYFMDFYMESPTTYYGTNNDFDLSTSAGTVAKGARLAIKIDRAAPKTGSVSGEVVHQGALSEIRGTVSCPPYPSTLEDSSDPKQWWLDHRPIIAQTAALGPIDPRQRFDPSWEIRYTFGNSILQPITIDVESKTQPKPKVEVGETATVRQLMTTHPDPTFNGFRLVQVKNNVIDKVRYITLAELRAANFVLPWESRLAVAPGAGLLGGGIVVEGARSSTTKA
jgi:LGFP repeat/Calcineurin-like phosphoesterase